VVGHVGHVTQVLGVGLGVLEHVYCVPHFAEIVTAVVDPLKKPVTVQV